MRTETRGDENYIYIGGILPLMLYGTCLEKRVEKTLL